MTWMDACFPTMLKSPADAAWDPITKAMRELDAAADAAAGRQDSGSRGGRNKNDRGKGKEIERGRPSDQDGWDFVPQEMNWHSTPPSQSRPVPDDPYADKVPHFTPSQGTPFARNARRVIVPGKNGVGYYERCPEGTTCVEDLPDREMRERVWCRPVQKQENADDNVHRPPRDQYDDQYQVVHDLVDQFARFYLPSCEAGADLTCRRIGADGSSSSGGRGGGRSSGSAGSSSSSSGSLDSLPFAGGSTP